MQRERNFDPKSRLLFPLFEVYSVSVHYEDPIMKATYVDLRTKSNQIIRALRRNERVTIFYRGKPAALMQPLNAASVNAKTKVMDHPAFGLWAKRAEMKNPAGYVRKLRRGRRNAL